LDLRIVYRTVLKMADPISLASGLLTLVMFGIKSSSSLYQTVKDFNSHQRNVRELREELEALSHVLASLKQAVPHKDVDFTPLKLPVLRCGNACNDFQMVIVKATGRSDGPKTSFRDWARLKYMGNDITGFKNMLAGYKSTITIALCGANLRTSAVTVNVLNEYQEMIKNTTSDLEDHLQNVDSKLQAIVLSAETSNGDNTERQEIQNERDSIQQCLEICAKASSHIEQVRFSTLEDISTSSGDHHVHATTGGVAASARWVTYDALGHCQDKLASTSSELKSRLADTCRRLDALNHHKPLSGDAAEQMRMQEEIESIKQSLAICAEAAEKSSADRINTYDTVSLAEDGHQLVVSTVGDLINARNVTAGARSAQWLGQMSDVSLQQLSRDRGRFTLQQATQKQEGTPAEFEDRYGNGHSL